MEEYLDLKQLTQRIPFGKSAIEERWPDSTRDPIPSGSIPGPTLPPESATYLILMSPLASSNWASDNSSGTITSSNVSRNVTALVKP